MSELIRRLLKENQQEISEHLWIIPWSLIHTTNCTNHNTIILKIKHFLNVLNYNTLSISIHLFWLSWEQPLFFIVTVKFFIFYFTQFYLCMNECLCMNMCIRNLKLTFAFKKEVWPRFRLEFQAARDAHWWNCKLIAVLYFWALDAWICLFEAKLNIDCMMMCESYQLVYSAIHSCWIWNVLHLTIYIESVVIWQRVHHCYCSCPRCTGFYDSKATGPSLCIHTHTHTLYHHIIWIMTLLFSTCCNSSWCCHSCARSWVWWKLSGWMARPLQNRAQWPVRLGIRTGVRCRHTPDSQHREPGQVLSVPGRPDIEHHSHTGGNNLKSRR